jgi:hypothetical protein
VAWSVRVGGVWMYQLAPVGDLKYSWGENGPLAASWGMALPVGFLHPALVQGNTVEIFYGPRRVWRGVLEEPDRDEWKCTAIGTADFLVNVANLSTYDLEGEDVPWLGNDAYNGARWAIGASGTPALPAGLIRGFDFSVDQTVPGGSLEPDPTPILEYGLNLRAAMDDFTARTGKRWMVDENGLLHVPVDPTTPTLALTPTVPGVGVTLENYYSATFLEYASVGDPTTRTVYQVSPDARRWGPRERTVVHDHEVTLSDAGAQAIVDALQAEAVAAPTKSVTLSDGQLINLGGTRVPLPMLKTNVMVTHFGVIDVPGARNVHQWVIGHFEMDTVAGTAEVSPRHIAPRTLAQVVQSINAPPVPRFTEDSDAA